MMSPTPPAPGSCQRVNFDTKTFETRGEFDAAVSHATLRIVTLSVNDEVGLAISNRSGEEFARGEHASQRTRD